MSISCFDKNGDGRITTKEFWDNSFQVFADLAFEEALRQDDPIAQYKGITPTTQPDLSWLITPNSDTELSEIMDTNDQQDISLNYLFSVIDFNADRDVTRKDIYNLFKENYAKIIPSFVEQLSLSFKRLDSLTHHPL